MIDPDRLDTARCVMESNARIGLWAKPSEIVKETDELLAALEATQATPDGHPAEVALEQLLNLLASHPDAKLVKWIAANARVNKLQELCAYLGAERE